MGRIAILALAAVVSLAMPVNAAEHWRCRIEVVRYNLPTWPPKTHVLHPNSEYLIEFGRDGFDLVPVKGDIIDGFRIIENSRTVLSGLGLAHPGDLRLVLDKQHRSITIVSRREGGDIARSEKGTCFGP